MPTVMPVGENPLSISLDHMQSMMLRHFSRQIAEDEMKIVVFGPERRVGAMFGDQVIDLNRASSQLPARLLTFIEAGT